MTETYIVATIDIWIKSGIFIGGPPDYGGPNELSIEDAEKPGKRFPFPGCAVEIREGGVAEAPKGRRGEQKKGRRTAPASSGCILKEQKWGVP